MTATTLTLTGFLLARIAEDEAVARRQGPAYAQHAYAGAPIEPFNDPARVLAECEAKRRIVTQAVDLDRHDGYTEATRDAVLALAAVYADHQAYRDEWRV